MSNQKTRVITGVVRFSYVHVFEPQTINEGDTPKYSVSLLIPKKDKEGVAKLKAAYQAAIEAGKEKFGDKWAKVPSKLNNPFRDGDEEKPDEEAYAEHYFISAKSKRKPEVIDRQRNHILDPEDFKSGDYGKASITFYPFDVNANKGVAVALNSALKLKDGEPLGAVAASAVDEFEDEIEDALGDTDPLLGEDGPF